MKMLMIVYNEALDDEVMELLERIEAKGYTKIPQAFGRGETSGAHLGTDIWPGLNNILYVACQDSQSEELLIKVKGLREKSGREGVKAFIFPLEEIT